MEQIFKQKRNHVFQEAIIASLNGGLISAVTFESFAHAAVGYATGNITFIASYIITKNHFLLINTSLLLFFFLIGAILSGVVTIHQSIAKYRLSFLIEGIIITTAIIGLVNGFNLTMFLLAVALGLQNGATTIYGNSIIRTTHMTGTLTDLGINIAHKLIAPNNTPTWKILIYVILLISFFIGSILGVVLFSQYNYYSLFLSVGLCLLLFVQHQITMR